MLNNRELSKTTNEVPGFRNSKWGGRVRLGTYIFIAASISACGGGGSGSGNNNGGNNQGRDLIGCSANCAAPADATPVTNATSAAGFYVTQFGDGNNISALWINNSGKYSSGEGRQDVTPGFEFGTLSFDASGNVGVAKIYDSDNSASEPVKLSSNGTTLVVTPAAYPTGRSIFERLAKDPANLLLGAWALSKCGASTFNDADPTQTIALTFLKSGHYLMLDSVGGDEAPVPGIEYGSFSQNTTAGSFRFVGNLYDTNSGAGFHHPTTGMANAVFTYTFSGDGNTMTAIDGGDACGTSTWSRIN